MSSGKRHLGCVMPFVLFAALLLGSGAGSTFAQPASQAEQPKDAETFTGTTVNLVPGAGETISIHVLRWSSDADRDRVAATFKEKGAAGLGAALEASPAVGIIWTGESLGYSLHYAHRVALPDGGERIIVATERRLGAWSRGGVWKAAGQLEAPDYPFTVIELRLNRRAPGEGKMSLTAPVSVEAEAKTIALEKYAAAPVLIKNVKRAAASGGPSTN